MQTFRRLIAVIFCGTFCSTLHAEEPVFDSIDYESPDQYLVIAESLGDRNAIAELAGSLKADSDRATLAGILRWMGQELTYDGDRAYQWRNFDTVISESCYGGCADQAIVCGVLLRSAGIPAVWSRQWMWNGSGTSGRSDRSLPGRDTFSWRSTSTAAGCCWTPGRPESTWTILLSHESFLEIDSPTTKAVILDR